MLKQLPSIHGGRGQVMLCSKVHPSESFVLSSCYIFELSNMIKNEYILICLSYKTQISPVKKNRMYMTLYLLLANIVKVCTDNFVVTSCLSI